VANILGDDQDAEEAVLGAVGGEEEEEEEEDDEEDEDEEGVEEDVEQLRGAQQQDIGAARARLCVLVSCYSLHDGWVRLCVSML